MHTKTVTLHTGLHNAILSASRDETLPMLCAIEITSDGKQLVLVSTDRFRLGMVRVQLDEGGGAWKFLLKLKDAETLLKSLKTVKRDAEWRTAEIEFETVPSGEVTKDVLTVKLNSGESFTFDGLDCDFPKWRQLLPDNGTESAEAMTGFTAEYLAAFGRVIADTPHMTLRHFGAKRPRVITIGENYVALLMPSVRPEDERAWTRPAWLAEPKLKRPKKTA